jgi:hypothetical protein
MAIRVWKRTPSVPRISTEGGWVPGPDAYYRRVGDPPKGLKGRELVDDVQRRRREATRPPTPGPRRHDFLPAEEDVERCRHDNVIQLRHFGKGDTPEAQATFVEEQIEEALEEAAAAPLVVRRSQTGAVGTLIKGDIDNQFGTGTSSGLYDPAVRKQAEYLGLGVPKTGVPPDKRPIYGYLELDPDNAIQYGGVKFYLKEEVKYRTTMTVGDSLDVFDHRDLVGTPVMDPGAEAANTFFMEEAFKDVVRTREDQEFDQPTLRSVFMEGRSSYAYVEAQIQGDVTLADIDRIEMNAFQVDNDYIAKIRQLAKEKGLRVEVVNQ